MTHYPRWRQRRGKAIVLIIIAIYMTKRISLLLLACSSVLLAGCSTYTSQYTKVSCSNEEVFIVDGQVSYID